jgi:methylated-DNA-[protein]-cysteine S-methyltransferase
MSETRTVRHGLELLPPVRRRQAHDYAAVLATPWAGVMLGVSIDGEFVTSIDFLAGNALAHSASGDVAGEAVRQLQAYFHDPQHQFSLPLHPIGTPFQLRVWETLRRIPAGQTCSYGEVAQHLGSGARAVGGACRANHIPVIIPCHRVVAAQGMGGFMGVTAGPGLQLKQRLLAHELPS